VNTYAGYLVPESVCTSDWKYLESQGDNIFIV